MPSIAHFRAWGSRGYLSPPCFGLEKFGGLLTSLNHPPEGPDNNPPPYLHRLFSVPLYVEGLQKDMAWCSTGVFTVPGGPRIFRMNFSLVWSVRSEHASLSPETKQRKPLWSRHCFKVHRVFQLVLLMSFFFFSTSRGEIFSQV